MADAPRNDALDFPVPPSEGPRMDAALAGEITEAFVTDGYLSADFADDFKAALLDGFQNPVTGIGDPLVDKSLGGSVFGPNFVVTPITGPVAESLWRGSDLGARIVETIPREMTRKGWSISIQPQDGEFPEDEDPKRQDDAGLWRKVRRLLSQLGVRRDEWPAQPASVAPAHAPGELPPTQNDGTAIVDKLAKEQRALGLVDNIREAICYRIAFGGGAVFMGIDDGRKLHEPVDEANIKSIRHLTAFRGGMDGELIAWSYYNELGHEKYGQPRIYMLRNLGVPISSPPAPGQPVTQVSAPTAKPTDPYSNIVTYVHESRLLIFPGQVVSHRVRVQLMGWSDSVFTRVVEVLAQFNQAWSGISILMQEFSIPVQSVKGLSAMLAAKDKSGIKAVTNRALAQKLSMSIAKMRMIDMDEKLDRMSVPLAGIEGILSQYWLRMAAAAMQPVSMLMGQVQGGLGDASKGDVLFFYDQIAGNQDDEIKPQVEKFTRLQMLAKTSPTKGVIPKKWGVEMNPLRQSSPDEEAKRQKAIADTDKVYIDAGVVTPEEVAATRYGGAKFNDGPIVLDIEGRLLRAKTEQAAAEKAAQARAAAPAPGAPGAPPAPGQPQVAPAPAPGAQNQPPAPQPAPEQVVPQHDSADFVTIRGRTKVRTTVAKIAVFGPDGRMLLGRRKENGKWTEPGGHAEPKETPLGCAIRELWEETGFHPRRIDLIGTKTVASGAGVIKIWIFRALVDGEPTAVNDPDGEFDAFQWVDLATFREQSVEMHNARDVVLERVL